jgi:hypothetical protein
MDAGLSRDELAVQSGWHQISEDAMAHKAERPERTLRFEQFMRNFAIGGVITSGALLWGYAVYSVAMRTM